ncbi:TIGR02186 family protein [Thalassospira lucentensis]|nr:TIGR02186 family protein [Thalassospira lucentensis]
MSFSPHMFRIAFMAAVTVIAATLPLKNSRADALVVDLSNHLVAITTGFTGTDVLLFGAVQNEGDIIVTVRGPDQDMVVRRKERTVGIWVNRESATFKNVPTYYASASNRPMDIIANDNVLRDYRIGLEHQRFIAATDITEVDQKAYRDALVRNMQNVGLFNQRPAKISFLSNQLFRTDIHFPANTPTGTYMINVYLIRDGRIASVKTTPLVVSKTGVSAEVYDFAHRYSALYGIIAVIIAVFSGWVASVVFRKG